MKPDPEKTINLVLENFDFEKVHKVANLIHGHSRTVEQLKEDAKNALWQLVDDETPLGYYDAEDGFIASRFDDEYTLEFVVEYCSSTDC